MRTSSTDRLEGERPLNAGLHPEALTSEQRALRSDLSDKFSVTMVLSLLTCFIQSLNVTTFRLCVLVVEMFMFYEISLIN